MPTRQSILIADLMLDVFLHSGQLRADPLKKIAKRIGWATSIVIKSITYLQKELEYDEHETTLSRRRR